MIGGKEALFRRRCICDNECLFCGIMSILLLGRYQQPGPALWEVSSLRELHWKEESFFLS